MEAQLMTGGHAPATSVAHDRRHEQPHDPRPAPHPVRTLLGAGVIGYLVLAASILLLGALLTGPFGSSTDAVDHAMSTWFVDQRDAVGEAVPGAVSPLADTTVVVCAALGFTVACVAARRWRPVYVLGVGLALELLVFLTVNPWLDRPRPDGETLGAVPSTASFPSGHAAASTVLYLSWAMVLTPLVRRPWQRRAVWSVAILVPLAVGVARVYRGVHHPTDVLAGWLLGVGCLIVTATAVGLIGRSAPER